MEECTISTIQHITNDDASSGFGMGANWWDTVLIQTLHNNDNNSYPPQKQTNKQKTSTKQQQKGDCSAVHYQHQQQNHDI